MKRFLPLLFILISCVEVKYENPQVPRYNIWLILNNPSDTQYLYFDRVYAPDEEASYGMDGADAIVWSGSDTFRFRFGTLVDSLYYYTAGFVPQVEDTYHLRLITPDSADTFHATTYVPGDFHIVNPSDGDTITVGEDSVILIWTSSRGAIMYKIRAVNLAYGFISFFPSASVDTFSTFLLYDTYFPLEGFYDVYVIAYNRDMYDYIMSPSDSNVNIPGAAGVFGGVVSRKVRLYIRVSP